MQWAATDALQGNGWLASSYIETIAITDGMDDIEVNLETNGVDKSSSDLELINDGNDQAVALLFRGLQVDNGASILSATIQFHADESQDEPTNLQIRALTCTDAAPCAPALPRRPVVVTQSTFGGRPLTRNSAAWAVEPWSVASHQTSTQSEAPQVIAVLHDVFAGLRFHTDAPVVAEEPGAARRGAGGLQLAWLGAGQGPGSGDHRQRPPHRGQLRRTAMLSRVVALAVSLTRKASPSQDGHPDKATTITLAVREGGAAVGVPDIYGVAGDYAHPNLLVNGDLDGPVDCTASAGSACIVGWQTNNAHLSIVEKAGRAGVLRIGDCKRSSSLLRLVPKPQRQAACCTGGSFSEVSQPIPTVPGQQYTLAYDVFVEAGQLHPTSDFCVSADSNGQMIARADATVDNGDANAADGHCGGPAHCGGNDVGEVNRHCHGELRLCPQTAGNWVTVSGTYIATSDWSTFALHSESGDAAYFDRVSVTTAPCAPSPRCSSVFALPAAGGRREQLVRTGTRARPRQSTTEQRPNRRPTRRARWGRSASARGSTSYNSCTAVHHQSIQRY